MNKRTVLRVIIGITMITALGTTNQLQLTYAMTKAELAEDRKAPPAISGENIYVAWGTNNTVNNNDAILFRASTDGGATFGDKINLSNTTNSDSSRVEIDSDADSVVVTWWETNQTADTPVMRASTDNGATFGPTLVIATNGFCPLPVSSLHIF